MFCHFKLRLFYLEFKILFDWLIDWSHLVNCRQVPQVEQTLFSISWAPKLIPGFKWVICSPIFSVQCFVDHFLSLCLYSFDHCIVSLSCLFMAFDYNFLHISSFLHSLWLTQIFTKMYSYNIQESTNLQWSTSNKSATNNKSDSMSIQNLQVFSRVNACMLQCR